MKSSGAWRKSARTCRSSRSATSRASAAWSIHAARARPARKDWSSSAKARKASRKPITRRTEKSGGFTAGGYSTSIVVDEAFTLSIPGNLELAAVAPLLCAGITTYSPLRHWNVQKGHKVGIVGLGGLGHMGVKIAAAMGAHVVLFTTSPGKIEDAKRLGAHEVVISKDPAQMAAHANSFDFILNTVAASHDLDPFMALLKRDATMTLVGAPEHPHPSPSVMNMIFKRRSLAGSLIGGIAETQEMLDFCAEHGITSDIEMIRMDEINKAYERMLKSDVKYRFVIDMATMEK
jgi:uncharacterized zinc-type alcohol dehydrogenase-like protein